MYIHMSVLYSMLCAILSSRLSNLLKCEGTRALGEDTDRDDLYISPTIITDVNTNDAIMRDEVHVYYICVYLFGA